MLWCPLRISHRGSHCCETSVWSHSRSFDLLSHQLTFNETETSADKSVQSVAELSLHFLMMFCSDCLAAWWWVQWIGSSFYIPALGEREETVWLLQHINPLPSLFDSQTQLLIFILVSHRCQTNLKLHVIQILDSITKIYSVFINDVLSCRKTGSRGNILR